MRKYKFTIRGNEYEVEIQNFENDIAELEVNGTPYTVEIHRDVKHKQTKTPRLVRPSIPEPSRRDKKIKKDISKKSGNVKAPLPGTIMSLAVKEGDEVKKGDKLLVMEAMKMENDVQAPRNGVVAKINVAPNDSVLQNDVLIEIQ